MTPRFALFAFACLLFSAGCNLDDLATPSASTADAAPVSGGPSEAEVKKIITDMFLATYKMPYMKDEELAVTFSNLRFAPRTKKNLGGGYYDTPFDVWPVLADVNVSWTHNGEVRKWARGTQNRESFSFYKDDAGKWNFKTSGL